VFHAAFHNLCFGFVIFWRKHIGAKGAQKMLMKLALLFKMFNGNMKAKFVQNLQTFQFK